MTDLGSEAALRLLELGALEIQGRILSASNATFVGTVRQGDLAAECVYKPVRGERPLEDFPDRTLARRERAAFLVSESSGWSVVPPTVLRRDGPFGAGMAQLWIDIDESADVWAMVGQPDERLRRIALFDVVVNNADRKGGHLLPTADGHVYGVDHGICFAVEPKLRTVLWDWRGMPIAPVELDVLRRLRVALDGPLCEALLRLLTEGEVRATVARLERLLATGRFPEPDPYRMVVPWPPF